MKNIFYAILIILIGPFTSVNAAPQTFSDATKAALMAGCKVDLPKKFGPSKQNIDPQKFGTVIASACFCVFTYTQQFGDALSNGETLGDKDYQLLALLLQKGTLTSSDAPDPTKKAAIEKIGNSYPEIIQQAPLQSCIDQTSKHPPANM